LFYRLGDLPLDVLVVFFFSVAEKNDDKPKEKQATKIKIKKKIKKNKKNLTFRGA